MGGDIWVTLPFLWRNGAVILFDKLLGRLLDDMLELGIRGRVVEGAVFGCVRVVVESWRNASLRRWLMVAMPGIDDLWQEWVPFEFNVFAISEHFVTFIRILVLSLVIHHRSELGWICHLVNWIFYQFCQTIQLYVSSYFKFLSMFKLFLPWCRGFWEKDCVVSEEFWGWSVEEKGGR